MLHRAGKVAVRSFGERQGLIMKFEQGLANKPGRATGLPEGDL